jgi:hypothetical protein
MAEPAPYSDSVCASLQALACRVVCAIQSAADWSPVTPFALAAHLDTVAELDARTTAAMAALCDHRDARVPLESYAFLSRAQQVDVLMDECAAQQPITDCLAALAEQKRAALAAVHHHGRELARLAHLRADLVKHAENVRRSRDRYVRAAERLRELAAHPDIGPSVAALTTLAEFTGRCASLRSQLALSDTRGGGGPGTCSAALQKLRFCEAARELHLFRESWRGVERKCERAETALSVPLLAGAAIDALLADATTN